VVDNIVTNQTRNAMYNQRALNVSSAAVQCRSLTPYFILFLDLGFSLYSIYTSVYENRVMSLVSFTKPQSKVPANFLISK
jgi:hypothetical protein